MALSYLPRLTMDQFKTSLMIGLGGALGTLCRYGLNLMTHASAYPLGTLLENLAGSLLLGILAGWIARRPLSTQWVNYVVGVGFCGGFTTMSTFAADTFFLSVEQDPLTALGYVAASLFGGLSLVSLGFIAGRTMAGKATQAHGDRT
jgi:fluoride exporter